MNKKLLIPFLFLFLFLKLTAQEKGHVQLTTVGGFYYPLFSIDHYGENNFKPRFSPAYNVGIAYSFPMRKHFIGETRIDFGQCSYELRSDAIEHLPWFGPFYWGSINGRRWEYVIPFIEPVFLIGKTIKTNKLQNRLWNFKAGIGIRRYLDYQGNYGEYHDTSTVIFNLLFKAKPLQPILYGEISRLLIFKNRMNFSYGAEVSFGITNAFSGNYRILTGTPNASGGNIYYNGGYIGVRLGYGFPTYKKKKDDETNGEIEMTDDHPIHLIPWYNAWFVSINSSMVFPAKKNSSDPLKINFTSSPGFSISGGRRYKINNRLAISSRGGFTWQSLGYTVNEDSNHIEGFYSSNYNSSGVMLFKRMSFSTEFLFETPLVQKKWFRLIGNAGLGMRFYNSNVITKATAFDTLQNGFLIFQKVSHKAVPVFSVGTHCEWPGRLGNLQAGIEFSWSPESSINGTYTYFVGTPMQATGSYKLSGAMFGVKIGYLFRTKPVPEENP